jgi:hypothetical protein
MACFFLDFDVGSTAEKFPVKADALTAIQQLESELLPCTAIVDSGGGYHAYWRLQVPVAADKWLPIAQQIKRALVSAGVAADPAVTADLARVLRVPGTVNRKTGTPRACGFVEHHAGREYSIEEIRAALHKYELLYSGNHAEMGLDVSILNAHPLISGRPPAAALGRPRLLLGSAFPPAPTPENVHRACPALQKLALTGGHSEEAWSLGIVNTAAFTSDPEAAVLPPTEN